MMGLLTNISNNYQDMDSRSPLCITKKQRDKLASERDAQKEKLKTKHYPQPVGEAVVVLHDLLHAKVTGLKKLKGV
jgi:hypothetical protein